MVDTLPVEEPRAVESRAVRTVLLESLVEQAGHLVDPERRLDAPPAARNVTAFDEVVASAWFEPRMAVRSLTPAEVARGPAGPRPDTTGPFTVVDAEVVGVSPGLTVEDASGRRFLLSFDPPGSPGLASGAGVVASRILWAAGYHVPLQVVVRIDPERLRIDTTVTVTTDEGERPLTRRVVSEALRRTAPAEGGQVRALASRLLPGTPKGPFDFEGTRPDDPNDYYPHEDRRELRGLWVVAAWVNHVDLRPGNTLDTWIDPPGYLRHHLIDFRTALGSGSIRALNPREGMEHAFDLGPTLARLVTAGFFRVSWEGSDTTLLHPSVGRIRGADFDPGGWRPLIPNEAFRRMTARDAYWGAKRVAAFSRDHVRAVVARARYPDPRAANIVEEVLMERRRRILEHVFHRVTPLEDPGIRLLGNELEVRTRDLGVVHGVRRPGESRYRWRLRDAGGGIVATGGSKGSDGTPASPGVSDSGRLVLTVPLPGPAMRRLRAALPDEPWVLEVQVVRPDTVGSRPARLRIAGPDGGGGRLRVTGLLHD